jgi:hypothetical protein
MDEPKEVVATPTEPTQPPQPTVEETLAKVRAELAAKDGELKKATAQTQSYKSSLAEKERRLKESEDIKSEVSILKDMVKVLAVKQARGEEVPDLDDVRKVKTPDIDAAFTELENKRKLESETKRRQEEAQTLIRGYQQRVQDLGLTENDETYWEVYDLVTSMDVAKLKRADIKLNKLEKEKKPVEEVKETKKTESEEEMKVRLSKEIEKEILKKYKLLDAETGQPSGNLNESQIRKAFRDNPDNPKARSDYLNLVRNK